MIIEYEKSLELASYGEMFKEQLINHEFSDEEYTFEEMSRNEQIALGFNIKYDVFKQYAEIKKKYKTVNIDSLELGSTMNILFRIDSFNVIKTKKGDEMAFITISDETSIIDGVLFPKVYETVKNDLEINLIALGTVHTERRKNKIQCVFEKIVLKKY